MSGCGVEWAVIRAGHAITEGAKERGSNASAAFKERKTRVFIAGRADNGGGVLWKENEGNTNNSRHLGK